MRTGRPLIPLTLTVDERTTLEQWTRRHTTAQGLALRARIILRAATGQSNTRTARELRVTKATVGKWRARFLRDGLQGVLDEPRPGAPRRITDAQVEHVITTTLESTPRDATHWSTRSMAKAAGLSQSAISRIWRAFALQPHRVETFKLSKDPLFIDKVRDIVGLYVIHRIGARALCGREEPNSSPGSHRADAAAAGRPAGTANARLPAPRHHLTLCGIGCGHRPGHRRMSSPSSEHGVPAVPQNDRRDGGTRPGPPSDPR